MMLRAASIGNERNTKGGDGAGQLLRLAIDRPRWFKSQLAFVSFRKNSNHRSTRAWTPLVSIAQLVLVDATPFRHPFTCRSRRPSAWFDKAADFSHPVGFPCPTAPCRPAIRAVGNLIGDERPCGTSARKDELFRDTDDACAWKRGKMSFGSRPAACAGRRQHKETTS